MLSASSSFFVPARARLSRWATAARRNPLLTGFALALLVPCAMLISITVRSLPGPIQCVHDWRQGETYSVAYAFVHESASFFFPKHAWRGDLSGIVGMEAPIYPYVAGLLMRVFGDAPLVPRLLNFAFFVVAYGWFARRIWQLEGLPYALGFLIMVTFAPAALIEHRQIQPDPMTSSFAVLAAVFFADTGRQGGWRTFWIGIALYTVSLLTKPIAVALLPAMFLFTVCGVARPSWRTAALRALCFAVPLTLMFAWDRWANHLVQAYMNGLSLISIDHDPKQMWREMQNADARRLILLGLVQVYSCSVSVFPAVLLGIPYAFRRPTRPWALPFLAWFVGMVIISLAFSGRYYTNWYYMLLFVPPLAFFGALGFGALIEVLCNSARDPLRMTIAITLTLSMFGIAFLLDPLDWEFLENNGAFLALHQRHGVVRNPIYWIVIVGAGLFALTMTMNAERLARVPAYLLTPLCIGIAAWSMVVPYKDQRQSLRMYTSQQWWESGHREAAEIREAVNRFSTPQDLFVMNGSNPSLLVRALRVGWAEDPSALVSLGPKFYSDRRGRFFMSFADWTPTPHNWTQLPVLARGERWELRCLDPNGCPPLEQ